MDENQVKEEQVVAENTLKNEAAATFNEAKEQMKNINFKEEAKAGKGLLLNIWKKPVETIKELAKDESNGNFKTALLLVAVWVVIVAVDQIISWIKGGMPVSDFWDVIEYILTFVKIAVGPVLTVGAVTWAIYFLNKEKKKPISRIITAVSVAYTPKIVIELLGLLNIISPEISTLTSPINTLLGVFSIVLLYFAADALAEKEDVGSSFKFFVLVYALACVVDFAFGFLEIGLYI